ncbi:MAG TPA: hypothetical protein VIQ22_04995 [Gammaproteobacteria bacterium]
MLMRRHALTAAAAAVFLSLPAVSQAGFSFTTGAEYTRGDYGTSQDTSTWYVPLMLGYAGKKSFFSITVPYISVDGSSEVTGVRSTSLPGPGGITTTTTYTSTIEERTDSGLGDILLRASYQLQNETPSQPWLGVTGKVKLGTADEDKFLGTGENDYALQLDIAKGAWDGIIGYHLLGDTATIDYDDILFGAVAYTAPLQSNWKMRTEFYTEEEVTEGVDPVREVSVTFGKPLAAGRNLRLYLVKGLSDSSPDWGGGVMLSTAF